MLVDIFSFSSPLILAATGALFSEYAGALPLFMEGLMTLSGFLTFACTELTHSALAGVFLSVFTSSALTFGLSIIVEKTKANKFIAALGMNLFYSALVSLLSSLFFGTRGVLISETYRFSSQKVEWIEIITAIIFTAGAITFLKHTQKGLYFRITGSNAEVLHVRGINPSDYRIGAWTLSAIFAGISGSLLSLRISSFVPNLAGGKGWLALAAVFLGRKKIWKIALYAVIFCAADFLCGVLQNFLPQIPSGLLLALPYIIALCLC